MSAPRNDFDMKLPYRATCFCLAAFAVSLASADQTYAGTVSSIVADLVRRTASSTRSA